MAILSLQVAQPMFDETYAPSWVLLPYPWICIPRTGLCHFVPSGIFLAGSCWNSCHALLTATRRVRTRPNPKSGPRLLSYLDMLLVTFL